MRGSMRTSDRTNGAITCPWAPYYSLSFILILIGVLPTWGYSGTWGYGPSGIVALILIILLILVLRGRI
jgi:hypothetical protein